MLYYVKICTNSQKKQYPQKLHFEKNHQIYKLLIQRKFQLWTQGNVGAENETKVICSSHSWENKQKNCQGSNHNISRNITAVNPQYHVQHHTHGTSWENYGQPQGEITCD